MSTSDTFAHHFFADSTDLFIIFDDTNRLLHVNAAWQRAVGGDESAGGEQLVDRYIHPDTFEQFNTQKVKCREQQRGISVSVQLRNATASLQCWYSCYLHFDPESGHFYALFHNISDQIEATRYMIQREERLKILVDNVNEYLYSVQYRDGAFVDTFHNSQCEKITGYTVEEFSSKPDLWYTMIYKDDRQRVIDNLELIKKTKKSFYIEHRIIHKSGAVRWISNSCVAVINEFEQKYQFIGFILDITEQKSKVSTLYDHATRDALTGIYNRWAGVKALKRSIVKAFRGGYHCTVCYCDINNLKEVNDRLGHSTGDELIKSAVSIILHELRSSDIFFRMGGDEFVCIFNNISAEDAKTIIHRIEAATEIFNDHEQRAYKLYISYGFSEYSPQKSNTFVSAEQLIEEADRSMYESKEKSREVFKSAMTA